MRRRRKKKKEGKQASNSESATMLFYFKPRLPAVSDAGRGGDHWVSPPLPARPLQCACACVNLLFYPHVTFQPVPPALPPSPKSLINKFACFLYPHMWRIWSKACLCFLVGFLSPSLSICAHYFFIFFSYFTCDCHGNCYMFGKKLTEKKRGSALSWQMSSVIMLQRRNEAFGRLPSWGEQRCQFPVLAAALVWHPYMVSQNSSPWRLSIPFRAANRISTHRLVFLFSPPTVPMTSSLLHSAASRVTLGVDFFFPLLKKTTTAHTQASTMI